MHHDFEDHQNDPIPICILERAQTWLEWITIVSLVGNKKSWRIQHKNWTWKKLNINESGNKTKVNNYNCSIDNHSSQECLPVDVKSTLSLKQTSQTNFTNMS